MALVYSVVPITLGYSPEVFSYNGSTQSRIVVTDTSMPYSIVSTAFLKLVNYVNTVTPVNGNPYYIDGLRDCILELTAAIKKGAIQRSKLFDMSMFTATKRGAIKDTIFNVTGYGNYYSNGMYSNYKFTKTDINSSSYYYRYNLGSIFGRDRLIASVDTLDPMNTFRFIPVSEWGKPEVFGIVSKFTGVTAPTDEITSTIAPETVFENIELIKSWCTLQEDIDLFFAGVDGTNIVINTLLKKIGNTPSELESLNLSYKFASWLAISIYPYFDSFFRVPELEDFKFYVYNLAKLYPYYTYSIEQNKINTSYSVDYNAWFKDNSYIQYKPLVDYMRVSGMPFSGICAYQDITCVYSEFTNVTNNFDIYVNGPKTTCDYGCNEAIMDFSYDKYKALGYSKLGYNFVSGSTVSFEGSTSSPYNSHVRAFLRLAFMDPRMFNNFLNSEQVYLYMIETHDDARVPESKLDSWYKGTKGYTPSIVYRHEQDENYTLYNPFLFYYPASKDYNSVSSISTRRALSAYNPAIYSQYNFTIQRSFEINVDSFEATTVDDYTTEVNKYSVADDLCCIFTNILEIGIKGSYYNDYKTLNYSSFANLVHNDIYSVLESIVNGIAGPIASNKWDSYRSFNLNNYTNSYVLSGSTEAQSIDMAYKTYWAIASYCYVAPSWACYLPILGNNNSVIPIKRRDKNYYGHSIYELYWHKYAAYKTYNGRYSSWKSEDCITADWGGADYSSTVYGYTNYCVSPCYTTLIEMIGSTSIFGKTDVMKTAGYRAKTCGTGYYASYPGQVDSKLTTVDNYYAEICNYPPIATKQLATMAYNNNATYTKDSRNCLFPEHPITSYLDKSRCCYFSDLNYGSYGEATFQMLEDIATYCAYDEMDRILRCYILCMYNRYASAQYSYYPEIEQFITSAYNKVPNSKVDHIKSVRDTLPVIDTFYDNYTIGLRNTYLEVLSNRLLCNTRRTKNRRLIYAFKYYMQSIKLIEVKKVKKLANVIAKTSNTSKLDPALFKPIFEVYSLDAIRMVTTCVMDYGIRKNISAIKTTFDLSNGLTEQNEDYGLIVRDDSNRITYNSSTVGYNAIASFVVTGGPIIKVIPLDSVLSSSIFGASNTYDLASSTVSTDFESAKNAIYSRTQLPKYSEFKVFTIPKVVGETSDGFNYYRAKILDSGSIPSIYLYAEKNGTAVSDTTVVVLGR